MRFLEDVKFAAIHAKNFFPKQKKRDYLVLGVTYRCNCRCSMCRIWEYKHKDEMTLDDHRKIASNGMLDLTRLEIFGGEPLMRDDLAQIIKIYLKNHYLKDITLSTNGSSPKKLKKLIKEIRQSYKGRILVQVSIDGDKKIHEKIRGNNIYENANLCLSLLEDLCDTCVRMVILKENHNQILDMYKKYGDKLYINFPLMDKLHKNIGKIEPLTKAQIMHVKDQMHKILLKKGASTYPYIGHIWKRALDYAMTSTHDITCRAFGRMLYIDPYGDIYPCLSLDKKFSKIEELDHMTIDKECRCMSECHLNYSLSKEPHFYIELMHGYIRWALSKKINPNNPYTPGDMI